MWTVSHQLILVITALTLKTDAASHMVDGSGDDGIGSGIDQIDIGKQAYYVCTMRKESSICWTLFYDASRVQLSAHWQIS